MKKSSPIKAGFTLIEIMSAMAVFSIMLLMILRIFTSSSEAMNTGTQLSKLDTESRLALDFIESRRITHWLNTGASMVHTPSTEVICYYIADRCAEAGRFKMEVTSSAGVFTLNWEDQPTGGALPPTKLMENVIQFNVTLFDDVQGTTLQSTGKATHNGCNTSTHIKDSAAYAVIDLLAVTSAVALKANVSGGSYDMAAHAHHYRRGVHLPLKDFQE